MALQEEFEKQGIWLFRYRGIIPLSVLLIGTLLLLRSEIHPEFFVLRGTPYEIYYEMFCLFLSLFGLGIRVYTVGYTPRNTSGRNSREQVADKLNTTGIYSTVRHPLYLGNYFMWMGPTLLTGNFWFVFALSLLYWIYYERIMFAEEQFLRRKFGDTYTNWAKNVPAFIPNFKHFQPPVGQFNWKKVIKKEKYGLAAIFLIFAAFDILGELIKGTGNYNYFLIAASVLSLLYFAVVRIMQKRTNFLKENSVL